MADFKKILALPGDVLSQKHHRQPWSEHKEGVRAPGPCPAAAASLLFCSSGHQQPRQGRGKQRHLCCCQASPPTSLGCPAEVPALTPCTGSQPGGAQTQHEQDLEPPLSSPGGWNSARSKNHKPSYHGSIPCSQVIPVPVVSCNIWHRVSFRLIHFSSKKKKKKK